MRAYPAEMRLQARELDAAGVSMPSIAESLGVHRRTVARWIGRGWGRDDPEAQRRRRGRYQGVCVDCGAPTDGSNGRAKAPKHCKRCAPDAHRVWTHEAITSAMQLYVHRYGFLSAAHLNPAQAAELGHEDWAERYRRDGDYPPLSTVLGVFDSWNAAMAAAGLPVRRPGERRRG